MPDADMLKISALLTEGASRMRLQLPSRPIAQHSSSQIITAGSVVGSVPPRPCTDSRSDVLLCEDAVAYVMQTYAKGELLFRVLLVPSSPIFVCVLRQLLRRHVSEAARGSKGTLPTRGGGAKI